jgi:hypothetical protein
MKKTGGQKSRETVSLSVTPVFMKQIFRVLEEAPPLPPPPTGLCRGWGSFGYGYEAVRIRVKKVFLSPRCGD